MRSAVQVLREAAALIDQRGEERDRAGGERSMLATVQAFNAITGHRLSEVDGWHFMELLKMARASGGCYKQDDYDDKAAYAALAAEAAHAAITQ